MGHPLLVVTFSNFLLQSDHTKHAPILTNAPTSSCFSRQVFETIIHFDLGPYSTTDVAGTRRVLVLKIKYRLKIWSESCVELMGKYVLTCCWQGHCRPVMVV